MKKIVALLPVLLAGCIVFANINDNLPANLNSAFSLRAKNNSSLQVNFTLPEYTIQEEANGGPVYRKIILPLSGTLMETGMPELPVVCTTIAIPHTGGVNIEVLSTQQTIIPDFLPYPVQQGNSLESPKGFIINNTYYSGGCNYPEMLIEYSEPSILRDFRIITIQINPFSYNAQSGELTVNHNIEFSINFTEEQGINELTNEPTRISASFDKIYESIILNYDDYRDALVANTPPRYLMIYGTNSDTNFATALNEFVLWKKQKGADVMVASTAANEAGNTTTSIKNYIQTKYNNPETRPDFIVLIGDTSGSYAIPYFTQSNGATDYNYTFLAGTDQLGDCFIGRISVENLSQLLAVLNKIYLYERDINLDTASWLNKMMLSGDNAPSGISTMYIHKYIKEMSLLTNPDYTFTEDYGSSPNYTIINQALNQGVGFYSFRGYIDWTPPSESALFNGYKLFHTVNITCGTNNYNSAGEVEAFVRYGTTASPKGAVTGIGMCTSSTHTTFNNAIHGGIFAGIFAYEMRSMGEALLNGRLFINQLFGVSSPSNATNFAAWCNLMGDPTMEVFTGIPNHFVVTSEDSIPVGLSLYDVAVQDSLGNPVEGAAVVLNMGGIILARNYTGADGTTILVLPSNMLAGNATLTISKHNFKPCQITIPVLNIATLVPGTMVIDDDNLAPSEGNENGLAGSGETIELFFGLTNMGTDIISGITGSISSNSPYITIANSSVIYPDVLGGETGMNLVPIVIQIAPNTPHQTMLRLYLDLTDSNSVSYHISEFIPVEAPFLEFVSYLVIDSNNQHLDPGEVAEFSITVKNTGTVEAENVLGILYTRNDLVGISDPDAEFGTLPTGIQVTCGTNRFALSARPEVLPGMLIPMQIKFYNSNGFEQFVDFTFTVGVVTQHDPLGPDAYGYVIYDWTDTSYAEAAMYDWHGISPSEGGLGTLVAISDGYASGNEGDQVGSDALEVVSLPFPFQFYGCLYNQITISSNGFIAFGVTANAEFRNYRIPGPMGPNPMIAPFWDDLATGTGSGIYTWFDRSNHSFVIEWHNMKNGKDGSTLESFQCILYDQSAYPTSFGDGPIKFQYQTFNNIDSQSGNRHGNYCTIGIEDHTGKVGLEYTFNNTYPTAAAPLSSGKALFITNVPVYHSMAHLLLEATYVTDTNMNGICEPGEIVELGAKIQNAGNLTAENVTGQISTTNEYVTITNATAEYYPIEPGMNGVNKIPFTFTIANNCPDGEVLNFELLITAGEIQWTRYFSLQVSASCLRYNSFFVDDHLNDFDGMVSIGESFNLIVNLENSAVVEATGIQATLSSTLQQLIIENPLLCFDKIGPNDIYQIKYSIDTSLLDVSVNQIPLLFTATAANGSSTSASFSIPYNNPVVFQDFELNNGSFISETGWVWGNPTQVTPFSGARVWATNISGNYPSYVNYNLYTPRFILETNSQLQFMHYYSCEYGYDGGNVSISTNNGVTWNLIYPVNGYNGNSLNGLNGDQGWTGNSGDWQLASFDLSQYAGQTVMFRFRFGSDEETSGMGWFIDDFTVSDVNLKTGYLYGVVYPSSGLDPSMATLKSDLRLTSHPDSEGNFIIFLPNGIHTVTATMPYHQSSTLTSIIINPENPVHYAEFTLIDLPQPHSISYTGDNDTGDLYIFWQAPEDTVLPIVGFKVYRKFNTDQFNLVQDSPDNSYYEVLTLPGNYKYYIVVKYLNADGTPSQVLNISFPFVASSNNEIPALVTKLNNNYPNPFNPSTTLSFTLAEPGRTTLTIYNLKGQLIKRLVDKELTSGMHKVLWNGKDENERNVASGVYFYRLQSKNYQATGKMLLLK